MKEINEIKKRVKEKRRKDGEKALERIKKDIKGDVEAWDKIAKAIELKYSLDNISDKLDELNKKEYPDKVSVDNFPKQKEYPTEIGVKNFPESPKEIKVSNFKTEKEVKVKNPYDDSKAVKALWYIGTSIVKTVVKANELVRRIKPASQKPDTAFPVKLVDIHDKFYTAQSTMSGGGGGVSFKGLDGIVDEALIDSSRRVVVVVQGTLPGVDINAPTALGNGNKTVSVAGTAEALAASTTCKSVTVKALTTNAGLIYVGDSGVSAANGFQLAAGDPVSMDIDDVAKVFIDSAVNGEGVTFIYVN